jgi:hypothetical protein
MQQRALHACLALLIPCGRVAAAAAVTTAAAAATTAAVATAAVAAHEQLSAVSPSAK